MMEIAKAAETARAEMNASMASSSYAVRATYLVQLERFASARGEIHPSQCLYDDWLATAGESSERRHIMAVIKCVDRIAETKAIRPDGGSFSNLGVSRFLRRSGKAAFLCAGHGAHLAGESPAAGTCRQA